MNQFKNELEDVLRNYVEAACDEGRTSVTVEYSEFTPASVIEQVKEELIKLGYNVSIKVIAPKVTKGVMNHWTEPGSTELSISW